MTNGPTGGPQLDPATDLRKLQLDYAWKWFSYHADQRVRMFNFMLIVFGVFATAIVTSVDKGLPSGFIAFLCFVAAALGLIFSLLDRRNRDLVWVGEEVLTHLENQFIFFPAETIRDRKDKKDIRFGILSRRSEEENDRAKDFVLAWRKDLRELWASLNTRRDWGEAINYAVYGAHRIWLPSVGYLMFIMFLAAGIWFLRDP
jgi:hypothetical protein